MNIRPRFVKSYIRRISSKASTANSDRLRKTSPALPTMIPCAGCSTWPLSILQSAGVPDARTGTWCSASWRSCSPAVLPADPWLQHVPADGPAFTPAACIPPRTPGPPAAKGFSPPTDYAFSIASLLDFVEFRLHKILHQARQSITNTVNIKPSRQSQCCPQ